MDDLISRQAAIEAIEKIFPADPMRNDYTQGITVGAALATEYIKQLPSAQPKRTEKRTETHACDCISRQQAIDAIKACGLLEDLSERQAIEILLDAEKLPSAQSDIIRCGECRHLHDNDCPVVGWGRNDDDYCAWAERDNDG